MKEKKLNILLVEDEASTARRTTRLVSDLLGEKLDRLAVAGSLAAAQQSLEQAPPDLILLDLNLNGQEGFELLRTYLTAAADTIIISAYRDRAIEAFEYGVLDFVPKPVRRERLGLALARFRQVEPLPTRTTTRLTVKRRGELRVIEVNNLLYARATEGYVELHLRDGGKELTEKSLATLAQMLPDNFFRLHKSYLANMDERSELLIAAGGRYQLRLTEGTLLPVGRSRYPTLKATYFGD
ncbi:MAG: LytTR family DNA-binding domain-containing protein [Bacteroidota bacterium]